jgi:hypothetical protein
VADVRQDRTRDGRQHNNDVVEGQRGDGLLLY